MCEAHALNVVTHTCKGVNNSSAVLTLKEGWDMNIDDSHFLVLKRGVVFSVNAFLVYSQSCLIKKD